jgi:hypothetical protein
MKLAMKIVLWMFGAVAALCLLVLGLQLYYRLTPVELNADAKAMIAETKHMTSLTDNGYRMHGLLAPEGIDPVQYGRCHVSLMETHRLETAKRPAQTMPVSPASAEGDAYQKRTTDAVARCGNGKSRLPDLKTPDNQDRIRPGFAWERLLAQATNAPAAIYFERWDAVLAGGNSR